MFKMPLNQEKLKQEIISIQDEMINAEDYEASKEIYATKLMLAFYEFLLSGSLSVTGTSSQGAFTGIAKFEV